MLKMGDIYENDGIKYKVIEVVEETQKDESTVRVVTGEMLDD